MKGRSSSKGKQALVNELIKLINNIIYKTKVIILYHVCLSLNVPENVIFSYLKNEGSLSSKTMSSGLCPS